MYVPTTLIADEPIGVGNVGYYLNYTRFVGVGDVMSEVCAVVGAKICKVLCLHCLFAFPGLGV